MIDVEIVFFSEQTSDGDTDKSKFKTNGVLKKEENGFILSYTEPDSEMGNSKTEILIRSEKHIQMKRTGLYEALFIMEEGKTHNCPYKTPFGVMDMEINTKKVVADISNNGGRLIFNYIITNNAQLIGENSLSLYIKPVK